MSFWSFLGSSAGAAAGEVVGNTLDSAGGFIKDIRTAITGISPEAKSQVEILLAQLEVTIQAGQQQLNLRDSQGGLFHSGWRPATGWTCVFALIWHYIARDFLFYFLSILAPAVPAPPRLDVTDLIALLVALLGLGGLRTIEKNRKGNS